MTDCTINNLFINAMTAQADGATITAIFTNGTEATFSAHMFNDLKSDSATACIYDTATAEVLYIKNSTQTASPTR